MKVKGKLPVHKFSPYADMHFNKRNIRIDGEYFIDELGIKHQQTKVLAIETDKFAKVYFGNLDLFLSLSSTTMRVLFYIMEQLFCIIVI